jgi:hypothetical protein
MRRVDKNDYTHAVMNNDTKRRTNNASYIFFSYIFEVKLFLVTDLCKVAIIISAAHRPLLSIGIVKPIVA